MGDCKFCEQRAGFMRSEHAECRIKKIVAVEGFTGVGVSLATDSVPGLPGVRGRTHIDEQSTGLPLADRTSPRFHMAHRLIIARRAARRKIHSGCKCNFLRRVSFFLDMARRGER
jgi:hypothetical protein